MLPNNLTCTTLRHYPGGPGGVRRGEGWRGGGAALQAGPLPLPHQRGVLPRARVRAPLRRGQLIPIQLFQIITPCRDVR